ncbi:MAG: FG-GAP-like repeat-containing protein [Planctomycetota bacterium]
MRKIYLILLWVALVQVSSMQNFADEPLFYPEFTPSISTFNLKSADLNRDGLLDLVKAPGPWVHFGMEGGKFQPPIFLGGDYPSQEGVAIQIADLDADGFEDVVYGHANQFGIFVFLGDGKGAFDIKDDFAGPTRDLKLVDLNEDGCLDLVACGNGDANFRVYSGDGHGCFKLSKTYKSDSSFASHLETVDVNGDGFQDVIVGESISAIEGNIAVYLGDGSGCLRRFSYSHPTWQIVSIEKSKIDSNDLVQDLVVCSVLGSESQCEILLGQGDGNFLEQPPIPFSGREVAVGEFDGDGITDLALTEESRDQLSILHGVGDGTFSQTQSMRLGYDATLVSCENLLVEDDQHELVIAQQEGFRIVDLPLQAPSPFPVRRFSVGTLPRSVTTGDFDADGILDVATANNINDEESVTVLLGIGGGDFSRMKKIAAGAKPRSICSADFNGDGFDDLATANSGDIQSGGSIWVQLGLGDGTFGLPEIYDNGELRPEFIRSADLNNDQYVDLVYCNRFGVTSGYENTIHIRYGLGDGTFTEANEYEVGLGPRRLSIQDINSDGLKDLLVSDYTFVDPGTTVLVNQGNGEFNQISTLDQEVGATGDFDGDGTIDLVSFGDGRSFNVHFGVGDGTFLYPISYSVFLFNPRDFFAGDFENDGNTDLAVLFSSGAVLIYPADGFGGFRAPQAYPVDRGGFGGVDDTPALGDFNLDGQLDFAFTNCEGGELVVCLNQFSNSTLIGDVNLDGFVDLRDIAQFVAVLVDAGFQIEADINCDGRVDLLDVSPFVELLNGQ